MSCPFKHLASSSDSSNGPTNPHTAASSTLPPSTLQVESAAAASTTHEQHAAASTSSLHTASRSSSPAPSATSSSGGSHSLSSASPSAQLQLAAAASSWLDDDESVAQAARLAYLQRLERMRSDHGPGAGAGAGAGHVTASSLDRHTQPSSPAPIRDATPDPNHAQQALAAPVTRDTPNSNTPADPNRSHAGSPVRGAVQQKSAASTTADASQSSSSDVAAAPATVSPPVPSASAYASWVPSFHSPLCHAHAHYLQGRSSWATLNLLLDKLLDITDSEYGYIGRLDRDQKNNQVEALTMLAVTNIAWTPELERFVRPTYLSFTMDHRTLVCVRIADRAVRATLEPYSWDPATGKRDAVASDSFFTNDAPHHVWSAGIPHAHPPLECYAAVNLRIGREIIGVLGVANRRSPSGEQGYNAAMMPVMEQLATSIAAIVQLYEMQGPAPPTVKTEAASADADPDAAANDDDNHDDEAALASPAAAPADATTSETPLLAAAEDSHAPSTPGISVASPPSSTTVESLASAQHIVSPGDLSAPSSSTVSAVPSPSVPYRDLGLSDRVMVLPSRAPSDASAPGGVSNSSAPLPVEEVHHSIVDSIAQGVLVCDEDGSIRLINRGAKLMLLGSGRSGEGSGAAAGRIGALDALYLHRPLDALLPGLWAIIDAKQQQQQQQQQQAAAATGATGVIASSTSVVTPVPASTVIAAGVSAAATAPSVRPLSSMPPCAFGTPMDTFLMRADGSLMSVECVLSHFYFQARQLVAVMISDNSERLRHQQERDGFISLLSHELRNPLHNILASASFLLDSLKAQQAERAAAAVVDPASSSEETRVAQTQLDSAWERECTELLSGINDSATLMRSLVDDVLHLSKLSAGKAELEHAAFDMPALLGNLMRTHRSGCASKGVQLVLVYEPPIAADPNDVQPALPARWFVGDSHKLTQILSNLLGNATKFTGQGSVVLAVSWGEGKHLQPRSSSAADRIAISHEQALHPPLSSGDMSLAAFGTAAAPTGASSTGAAAPPRAATAVLPSVSANASTHSSSALAAAMHQRDTSSPSRSSSLSSSSRPSPASGSPGVVQSTSPSSPPVRRTVLLQLSVIDSGIGIAPESLSSLFMPYKQVQAYVARKYGGTGLGLSIVARLVRLLGGEVIVRSGVGRGTEFVVSLPLEVSEKEDNAPWFDTRAKANSTDQHAAQLFASDFAGDTPERMARRLLEASPSPDAAAAALAAVAAASTDAAPSPSASPSSALTGGVDPSPEVADPQQRPLPALIAQPSAATTAPSNADACGDRILFVDDVALNVKIGVRMLRSMGVRAPIDVAYNGLQCVAQVLAVHRARGALPHAALPVQQGLTLESVMDMLKQPQESQESNVSSAAASSATAPGSSRYALILLDVQMDELNGLDACRLLRSAGFSMSIAALTGNALEADQRACTSAGFTELLPKPFEAHQLRRIVETHAPHLISSTNRTAAATSKKVTATAE